MWPTWRSGASGSPTRAASPVSASSPPGGAPRGSTYTHGRGAPRWGTLVSSAEPSSGAGEQYRLRERGREPAVGQHRLPHDVRIDGEEQHAEPRPQPSIPD